jgi:hemoglobin/transferrin/lactoferrin receptor protein
MHLALAGSVVLAAPVKAQEPAASGADDGSAIDLDAITVTATKAGEQVYDSLSGSSVIGRNQIETQIQPMSCG